MPNSSWSRRHLISVVLFLISVLGCNVAFSEVRGIYRNSRFGYSIEYPANLLYPQGESENGDGQKFSSRDSRVVLIVYGSNNALEESLEEKYLMDSKGMTWEHPKRVVTYKVLRKNWYVVSGVELDSIFYSKTIRVEGGFSTFEIRYPKADEKLIEPLIGKISSSFKAH